MKRDEAIEKLKAAGLSSERATELVDAAIRERKTEKILRALDED